MAKWRISRQAVTPKGVLRRLGEIPFRRVSEPRKGPQFKLPTVLRLTVLTLMGAGNSQRAIESRSEQLRSGRLMESAGFGERIADNTVGTLLPRLNSWELRAALHVAVKAEHRRGNLDGRVGGRRVAALDGKVLAKVSYKSLIRAARAGLAIDDLRAHDAGWRPDKTELQRVLLLANAGFVQLVEPRHGELYGLVRLHRWTLVSAGPAVCIDEAAIDGSSNELAAAPMSMRDVAKAYARTSLFDTVTADAGNTSVRFASAVRDQGLDYVLAIKQPNGDIHAEAVRTLERAAPAHTVTERRCGRQVHYHVAIQELPDGFGVWEHARQLVRVERSVTAPDGTNSLGVRYYVTSLERSALSAKQALAIVRAHWRCENENHWTADTVFKEDARRAPLSRHPVGMLVASLLRMLAQNILAVLRSLSRVGSQKQKPSWRAVRQHVAAVAFRTHLDAGEFDAVA